MNNNESGHQAINCDVTSCVYNQNGNHCSLSSIQVSPRQNMSNGAATDESMCSSYQCRGMK